MHSYSHRPAENRSRASIQGEVSYILIPTGRTGTSIQEGVPYIHTHTGKYRTVLKLQFRRRSYTALFTSASKEPYQSIDSGGVPKHPYSHHQVKNLNKASIQGEVLCILLQTGKYRTVFNLSYDKGLMHLSYDRGGGGTKCPPIFICENDRKINKIMHCVEIFFF